MSGPAEQDHHVRLLREEYDAHVRRHLWDGHFWSGSYCAGSRGGAPRPS
ncbi:transposase [Streptomyces gamaensis]|uniref:Transposase n=1 Tax=Streptomyces gamaensis TaxID=1763542 RepID=A0ABW0Z341_9ACTN